MQCRKSFEPKEFQVSEIKDDAITARRMLRDVFGEDAGVRRVDLAAHADDNHRRRRRARVQPRVEAGAWILEFDRQGVIADGKWSGHGDPDVQTITEVEGFGADAP